MLAVLRLNILLYMAICPFLFGPIVGHATTPDKQGAIAGFLVAVILLLLCGPIVLAVLIFLSFYFTPDRPYSFSFFLKVLTLIVPALVSIIGGYLGGRSAKQ